MGKVFAVLMQMFSVIAYNNYLTNYKKIVSKMTTMHHLCQRSNLSRENLMKLLENAFHQKKYTQQLLFLLINSAHLNSKIMISSIKRILIIYLVIKSEICFTLSFKE